MNRNQRPLAIVEDDMATRAGAQQALEDLEAMMVHLAYRPVVTRSDIDRMSDNLRRIRAGLASVKKHLMHVRKTA